MKPFQSLRLLAGIWLFAGLAAAPTVAAAPLPDIVMAGTEEMKQSFYGDWLSLIYGEAFRRLGYRLVYNGYPAKRAGVMADQGEVDGEINRVVNYGSHHPNLVRVEESHFAMRFAAYGIGTKPVLRGWQSLKRTTYRVEYRSGVAAPEHALPTYVAQTRLSSVASVPLGLRKLMRARTDIFIDVDRIVERFLNDDEFKDANIINVGTMEEIQFHAFLHKNRAQLAPALALVLRNMKNEGLIDQFRRKAEAAMK
jgi:polar amino acid transport system substrate-binding protein